MIVPFILCLISLVGVVATLVVPAFSDLILLAVPCAFASAILLLRVALRSRKPINSRTGPARPRGKPGSGLFGWLKKKHIIVDGSNVMHWNGGIANIQTVRDVLQALKKRGLTPGVVFDANAGHILTGRYQHHRTMAKLVGLSDDRVLVVHKGTIADEYILTVARGLNVSVVTNDRYRDWAEAFPEVREPGRLVRGGYRDGVLWMDMAIEPALAAPP